MMMKLNSFRPRSTRTTFLLAIAPVIICLTLSLIFFGKYRDHKISHQYLVEKLGHLIKSQQTILAKPLWNVDDKRVQQVLGAMHHDPDLAGTVVFDDSFSRFGSSGILAGMSYDEVLDFAKRIEVKKDTFSDHIIHYIWNTDNLSPLEQDLFIRKSDIFFTTDTGTEKIGTMFFVLTSINRLHEFSVELGRDVFNILIITIILVITIMMVYTRTTSVPLKKLHNVILAIQQGKEHDIVDWESRSEVGRAIAAFNELQSHQLRSQKDLEETRDTLEIRVQELQERTIELRESENRFEMLLEQVPNIAVQGYGPDGTIQYWNKASETIYGYAEDEAIGHNLVELIIPSEMRDYVSAVIVKGALTGEMPPPEELKLVRKDGSLVDVFSSYAIVQRPGHETIMFCLDIDITDRKKSEVLLQKSKEEWQKTFNAMNDIVTIQDKDMRIVRANKAAHDFLKIDYGGLVGKYCYEVFSNNTGPCPGCPELKTLETAQCHSEIIEHENLGKIFDVSSAPILGENNEIDFLVHIAKDITETKRLEEELFQAHKMEAIGTMAGGIAHDFNNILSAIIGFAKLAKQDLPEDSSAVNDIDEVISSSCRAADLVQQILTFSRKSEHDLQSFNPHLIVKEVLRMLGSSLPSTVIIHEDIDKGCGKILADPINIHQIMMNLCTNALHAMEKETGTLTVKLYRREITAEEIVHESGVSVGPFVVLSISDTGHGIDEAIKGHIFEPYFTTKEMGKGTGMGLAVTHGIIQDYKGFVRVDSALGVGSTFSVYIPALQEVTSRPEGSAPKESETKTILPTGNERILVVDDEPLLVKINEKQLESCGYTVTGTTDSRDALEKIRTQPEQFDLLITDQTMPGLSGVELAKEVQKIKPALPIILCTGHSDVVSKEDALAMGIKRYVTKPIYRDELFLAIREVLDEKQACSSR